MPAEQAVDHAARALADPTRRAILRVVHDTEQTVGAIAAHFPVSRPAISQHLRVLREADLVTTRDEGTRRFYRSRPAGLADLREWVATFWDDALDTLKVEVEEEHRRRGGAAHGEAGP